MVKRVVSHCLVLVVVIVVGVPARLHGQVTSPGEVDGGAFTSVQGLTRNGLARLNPDGSLDPTFTLQPDGSMYIGGGFSSIDNIALGSVARLTAAGVVE